VRRHNSGVYVTDIPYDPVNQCAAIDYESAESTFVPNMTVPVDADTARKVFALIEALEDVDDVQNVFTNIDISEEVLAQLAD
jgi:transcriptional/translational regulatory protein YebC/TACO1